jgi:glycosyltransferase involved in cell wall biosynthesis
MQLSIVIPAFNEEKRIGASLQEIVSYLPKHFSDWEVIVGR